MRQQELWKGKRYAVSFQFPEKMTLHFQFSEYRGKGVLLIIVCFFPLTGPALQLLQLLGRKQIHAEYDEH